MKKISKDLPDMGHSPFGPMQNFIITVPGVTKLLKTLKIHKAAGPDVLLLLIFFFLLFTM